MSLHMKEKKEHIHRTVLKYRANRLLAGTGKCSIFSLNIFILSSIVKQVLATYINHFLVPFLEPTSTGVT
jgi:hypothetical protein